MITGDVANERGTTYRASHTVASETIDDESIVIDLVSGAYYSFCGWTAWAWESLCAGADVATMQSALADVGGVTDFVEQLIATGMIVGRDDAPATSIPAQPSGAPEPLVIERFDDMADMIKLDPVHDVDRNAGWPRPNDA